MDSFSELTRSGKFTAALINQFQAQFGELFFKALEYLQVEGKKVFKHKFTPSDLILWSVEGTDDSYFIFPDVYCQCTAFQIDTIYRKRSFSMCKHLLAQKLAECHNQFELQEHSDAEWKEWKKHTIFH